MKMNFLYFTQDEVSDDEDFDPPQTTLHLALNHSFSSMYDTFV